jgi:DNA-binding transcriptional MocR family regulator
VKEFASIQLNKQASVPVYRQLGDAFCRLIAEGVLEPHRKLPPIRKMANGLRINNDTVINAYKYLESKGAVYSVIGSGTYVSESLQAEKDEGQNCINFADPFPSKDLFPLAQWKEGFAHALDSSKGSAFTCGDSQGDKNLREALALKLGERGIISSGDCLQVIAGHQNCADIVSRWLSFGDWAFVEKPGPFAMSSVFASKGIHVEGIEMESDGISIDCLASMIEEKKPKLVCVSSHYQQPTGACLSMEKKRKLLDLALEHKFYILEDDSLGELAKNRQKSLKAMDPANIVIHMESFARLCGVRIGFMTLLGKRQSPRNAAESLPAGIIQKAFAHFVQSGGLEEASAMLGSACAERMQTAEAAIDECLPNSCYLKPKNGATLWLSLGLRDPQAFYLRLAKRGVIVVPGSVYSWDDSFICLNIAGVGKGELVEGIKAIAEEVARFGTAQG